MVKEREPCGIIARFHDEFRECADSIEHALIEHFLLDESKTIEERQRNCEVLTEALAIFAGAFNLNLVVQQSGIREQMYDHFGL